jgi:hypothetical protein
MVAGCREGDHAADIEAGDGDVARTGRLGGRQHQISQHRLLG